MKTDPTRCNHVHRKNIFQCNNRESEDKFSRIFLEYFSISFLIEKNWVGTFDFEKFKKNKQNN